MRLRLLLVMLKRNEHQTTPTEIPPHELPVLAYVHGEENVSVVGEHILDDRELSDPSSEFARLTQKYGRDKANESMDARVAAVYGNAGFGLRALAQAMQHGQREDVDWQSFILGEGGNELAHTQTEEREHREAPAGKRNQRASSSGG